MLGFLVRLPSSFKLVTENYLDQKGVGNNAACIAIAFIRGESC